MCIRDSIKTGNNIPIKRKKDFLDSPAEMGVISGSIENPFCLPPLSVVYPFLFMKIKNSPDYPMNKFFQ